MFELYFGLQFAFKQFPSDNLEFAPFSVSWWLSAGSTGVSTNPLMRTQEREFRVQKFKGPV